ncbi:MAG: ADOP family duplicated permease [Candidatus Acidiferrales bacterium]
MSILSSIRTVLGFLLRRRRAEREMEEELRSHLRRRMDDLERQGLSRNEAERQARIEFGGYQRYKEECREVLGTRLLNELIADVRYGLRQLRRNPGFTALAVLALGLGLGVNTGIFSLAEGVLYPPFAGHDPSHLAAVYTSGPNRSGYASSSYPDYVYYREHSRAFSAITAYARIPVAWTHSGTTELRGGGVVSSNYFNVAGVQPVRGRFFLSSESYTSGETPVVVVSYRFWREQMKSAPRLARHALMLDGNVFTVIGVAPEGFEGIQLDWGQPPDFWVPINVAPILLDDSSLLANGQARFCLMTGRLRPNVTIAEAGSEIRLLASQLEHAYPQADKARTALVIPFEQGRIWPTWRQKIKTTLWGLGFFAGLVLLVACADVANLLLARGVSRQKELGVRLALGASRTRVMRQLFTEGLLVSLAGAGAGIVLAYAIGRWITGFRRLFTIQLALHPAALDGRVLLFAFILAIATGVVFSLVPAFQSSHVDLNATLKQSGFQASTGGHRQLRHALVIAEIALAFVGIAGAATLLHTLGALNSTKLGLDPSHVVTVSTELATRHYTPDQSLRFYSGLLDRASSLPGVRSAALVSDLPLTTMHSFTSVQKPIHGGTQPGDWQSIEANTVSSGYFQTFRTPFLRGRDFNAQDTPNTPPVVIINRTMAQTFWPGENPVGKHLLIKGKTAEVEVIGVTADLKQHDLWEAAEPLLYEPVSQSPGVFYHLLLRTRGDPMALLPAVRRQVGALDPQVPVYGAETMEQVAADSTAEPRLAALLVSSFGTLVLILAVAGIYGVISYWVTQRTHEIGIRMALGAQKPDVLKMVTGQAFKLALAGIVIGIAGALALTRFLSSLLYGVRPDMLLTLASISLALIGISLLACYIPARRAAKVDPMVALRHE